MQWLFIVRTPELTVALKISLDAKAYIFSGSLVTKYIIISQQEGSNLNTRPFLDHAGCHRIRENKGKVK
jgi:hypothetical protein